MERCIRCKREREEGSAFCSDCRAELLRRTQPEEQVKSAEKAARMVRARLAVVSSPTKNKVIPTAKRSEGDKHEDRVETPTTPGEQSNDNKKDRYATQAYPSDPLIGRLLPQSGGFTEQQAIGRGDDVAKATKPRRVPTQRRLVKRLRIVFIVMVVMALVALLVDMLLASRVFEQVKQETPGRPPVMAPLLTPTPSIVYQGQIVRIQLSHFPSAARVLVSRDIRENVRLNMPSQIVQVDAEGKGIIHLLIEDNWEPGVHYVEAEDMVTHYAASVALQVMGAGPALPPRLQVNLSDVDMGSDVQGANTLRPLILKNSGGGIISWAASSDAPWLMVTPKQGIFSGSQYLSIAVSRERLKSGRYQGELTIASNTGQPVRVRVVLAVSTQKGALIVTPPALAFTATDGEEKLNEQTLHISNTSKEPLHWSSAGSVPTASVNQHLPFQSDLHWLQVSPSTGTIKAGGSATIRVRAMSRELLPNVYDGIVMFTASQGKASILQPIAVSLHVQPQCGVQANVGALSFIATAGESTQQQLHLQLAMGCKEAKEWSAYTLADWLSLSPANGLVERRERASLTVNVNAERLSTGRYTSFLVFLSGHHTQAIGIQLSVLPLARTATAYAPSTSGNSAVPLPTEQPGQNSVAGRKPGDREQTPIVVEQPGVPLPAVSPTNLTFTVVKGRSSGEQQMTIANAGGSLLSWQAGESMPWLRLSTVGGKIEAGRSVQVGVSIDMVSMEVGNYKAQISLRITDSSGKELEESPQLVGVTLEIVEPCVLQVSPATLSFRASLLQPDPAAQTITLQHSGYCAIPLLWSATIDTAGRPWLTLSASSGSDSGNGVIVSVLARAHNVVLGSYSGHITFSSIDNDGFMVSSQTVTVHFAVFG